MVKMRLVLLLFVLFTLSTIIISAEDNSQTDCIYYFYWEDFANCANVDQYIKSIEIKYPSLQVHKYEVYYEKENFKLLDSYLEAYGLSASAQGVPAVFLPGTYLIGEAPILNLLEERIVLNDKNTCPEATAQQAVGVVGAKSSKNVIDTLTFFKVTNSALKDRLKSGSLVLLLIFLPLLAGVADPDLLKKGGVFIVGVFISLAIFGFGNFIWMLNHPDLGVFFIKILGLAAAIYGVIGVKYFFGSKLVFNPREKFKYLLTYPGFFICGFLVSMLMYTHLSKTFLSMRILAMDPANKFIVIPLIFYYCIVIAMLLVFILLIVYFIREKLYKLAAQKGWDNTKEFDKWKKHTFSIFHFGMSVFMILLGLYLLFA